MARDVIRRNPPVSMAILTVWAVGYVWLYGLYVGGVLVPDACKWLWFFAVPLSAIFDSQNQRRYVVMLIYAVITGSVFACVIGDSELVSTIFAIPIFIWLHGVIIAALEWGSQRVLNRVRIFQQPGTCERCGYPITHLTIARCPECGTSFNESWLRSEVEPEQLTRPPKRVIAFVMAIASIVVAFPFAYSAYEFYITIPAEARAEAARHWDSGEPYRSIKPTDPRWNIMFPQVRDPNTGLWLRCERPIRGIPSKRRLQRRDAWKNAYRATITKKLDQAGGKHPIVKYLLSFDQIEALLSDPRLKPLPNNGLRFGGMTFQLSGDTFFTSDGRGGSETSSPHQSVRYVILPEKHNVLFLAVDDNLYTYRDDGMLLQVVFQPELPDLKAAFKKTAESP